MRCEASWRSSRFRPSCWVRRFSPSPSSIRLPFPPENPITSRSACSARSSSGTSSVRATTRWRAADATRPPRRRPPCRHPPRAGPFRPTPTTSPARRASPRPMPSAIPSTIPSSASTRRSRGARPMHFIVAAYAPENFWDGRARSTFVNPETGTTSILQGGGLESQAVGPILSPVEMAHQCRTWSDVRAKLTRSLPLRDATDLPTDLAAPSRRTRPTRSSSRPPSAIFDHRRADRLRDRHLRAHAGPRQTPWDRYMAGNTDRDDAEQMKGWNASATALRRLPPRLPGVPGAGAFRNIGIRPPRRGPRP